MSTVVGIYDRKWAEPVLAELCLPSSICTSCILLSGFGLVEIWDCGDSVRTPQRQALTP